MLGDFRIAARSLIRDPWFTILAAGSLALGVGANTAIFSILNSLLLHPPGVVEPERLVTVRVKYDKISHLGNISNSGPDFLSARDQKDTFSSVAAMQPGNLNYTEGDRPERLVSARVTVDYFRTYGMRPILGREFRPEEDQPKANYSTILSYRLWQRLFGGDPKVIGRKMRLNNQDYEVVGVMDAEFKWPERAELWTPLGLDKEQLSLQRRHSQFLFTVARLKEGVSLAKAQSVIAGVTQRVIADEMQNQNAGGWSIFLIPFLEQTNANVRRPLLVLSGAVAFVLLIACANIAGLLLAKASGRAKETAVRAALGASRWRIMQQLLAESLLLSVLGAVAGIALGFGGMKLLMMAAPANVALKGSIDWTVLAFTAVVSISAGLVFGMAPAWQLSGAGPQESLKEGGRSNTAGRARQRARGVLVASEIALALMLLVGAGLFFRSLSHLQQVDVGFEPRGVVSAMFSLPNEQYTRQEEKKANFFRALLDRLQSQPALKNAALAIPVPFSSDNQSGSFSIVGKELGSGQVSPHGDSRFVTPSYFETMGIKLLRGRVFTMQDRVGTEPVMVIDERLAQTYWPNEDPVGSKMNRGYNITVIGVVSHVRHTDLLEDNKGCYYASLLQTGPPAAMIVAKGNAGAGAMEAALRKAMHDVDPNQPLYDVKMMEERVSDSLGTQRFAVRILSVFAGFALLMAALGLYGMVSYSVTLRTQEIGVRVALGAGQREVLGLILGQGLRLTLAGVAAGLCGAYAIARVLSAQLYGVGAFDVVTFVLTALVLGAVALVASYVPARRALRVDPMVALRYE